LSILLIKLFNDWGMHCWSHWIFQHMWIIRFLLAIFEYRYIHMCPWSRFYTKYGANNILRYNTCSCRSRNIGWFGRYLIHIWKRWCAEGTTSWNDIKLYLNLSNLNSILSHVWRSLPKYYFINVSKVCNWFY
jgi:hypothetical protein